jgi:TolB-like protein
MPQATYVPDIRDRRPSIAISLIENWHPTHDQDHLCGTISDDIAYCLGASGRVRVVRVRSLVDDVPSAILYGLRGSLEIREDLLRVNVSLASLTGSNVFWRSFEQHRDDVFKLTREIVGALLTSLHLDTEPTIGIAVARRKRS